MYKKKKSFTIIEIVIAFSLISTALFFLFSTLKNIISLHHKMKKEIPLLVEQEMGFLLLKNAIRKIDLKNHKIALKNNEFSFYFIPEDQINLEKNTYFAKCLESKNNLIFEIYKKDDSAYKLFQSTILLKNISFINFTLEEKPKTILIEFSLQNTPGYWTFFIDPYLIID